MESLLDIELPPTLPDVVEETKTSTPERELGDISEESERKEETINEDSSKKISLTITPPCKVVNNVTLSPPKITTSTDNLLNINFNFSKATVLGKEQAKKRLQAFSSTKPASFTTVIKKSKSHECKEDMVKKKRLSAEEKAESVIKEIEDMKKAQMADSVDKELNQIEFNVKFKDKIKNTWKPMRKYKLPEHHSTIKPEMIEYPKNWQQYHLKHHSLESLKEMPQNVQSDKKYSFDYRKQANFELPALPVTSYKYTDANGEEKNVPFNYVRYTYRSGVPIAYNPNLKLKQPKYFTRDHFFSIINKSHQEEITKLLSKCSSDRRTEPSNTTQRNWYPKSTLSYQKKECEILEPSVGLSILKMYSDEEEKDNEIIYANIENTESKNKKQNSATPEHLNKFHQESKKKKKKSKKSKKMKKNKRSEKEKSETNSPQSGCNDPFYGKEEHDKITSATISEEFKQAEGYSTNENDNDVTGDKDNKKSHTERLTSFSMNDLSKWDCAQIINYEECVQNDIVNTCIEPFQEESTTDESKNEINKKTGDYTSHWESDEDLSSLPSVRNIKIDCEREKKPSQSLSERCLEMPLNIQTFTRRPFWEEREIMKIKQLEEERKQIQEERKKLEMEKKRLAELEKAFKLNLLNNDIKIKSELLGANSLSGLSLKETEEEDAAEEIPLKIKQEKVSDDDTSSRSFNNSSLVSTTSQPPKINEIQILNDMPDFGKAKESNDSTEKDQSVLETEYEEFIRDISQQSNESKKKLTKVKKRRYSSSTSSTSSSDTEEVTSDSTASIQKECTFDIQPKDENLDLPEEPIPKLINEIEMPRPVPVPTIFNLSEFVGSKDGAIIYTHIDNTSGVPKQQFTFTKISLPSKKNLLESSSAFHDTEDSNNSVNENEKKKKKNVQQKGHSSVSESNSKSRGSSRSTDKGRKDSHKSKRSRSRDRDNKDRKNDSPRRHRRESPKSYKDSKRKDYSPRRKRMSSPRRSSSRKRDNTPKRNISPRRRSSPRRRKGRDRSYSPRKNSPRNYTSPRSYSPRGRSPKRIRRNSLSPKNRSLSPSRKNSSSSRKESIQVTLQRIAGMDEYSCKSPVDSPLGGFRRSLADSTISDDLLMHTGYNESPYNCSYYQRTTESPGSPKRLSLDDRINQVLGIEKEQKAANQMYQDYNYGYYDQYGQYQYNDYGSTANYHDYSTVTSTPNKVVQVGNVLQVVPTEDVSSIPCSMNTSMSNENKNNEFESTPKIVQVGNMLQIVPTELPQTMSTAVSSTTAITTTISTTTDTTDKFSAEALMKQKSAEARAEREKRRNERERRRKEKEKKLKEKEKKKQLKMKKKTENMIKRALLLDTEEETENVQENEDAPSQWPPAPIIISTTLKNIGKGILMSHGFGNKLEDDEKKKSVKFADGIIPGEGTSPSGGEELTSPPPTPQKLPKEKRFTKTKKPKKIRIPKKKKIKVKIIRTQNISNELDDEEDDILPPPSPPPGSPPSHIFPPRIKMHAVNNLHSSFQTNLPTLPINNNFSSYRTPINTMSHHHHGHHHHPHGGHQPPPPMHGCPPPGPVIHHPPPPGPVIHSPSLPCHPAQHCGPPPHHHHAPTPPHPPHHHHHHH